MKRKKVVRPLSERFPPSDPCECDICRSYCVRPGWWTVEEAAHALAAGYGNRMMLELSPDRSYGVLSPAFTGCEGAFAMQEFAKNGCNFYRQGLCGLFGTGFEPLECRYCHHEREGMGLVCHDAIAQQWRAEGHEVVRAWLRERSMAASGSPVMRPFAAKAPEEPKG